MKQSLIRLKTNYNPNTVMPGCVDMLGQLERRMTFELSYCAPNCPVPSHFDKDWANSQLRFAIKLLKGQGCNQSFERAVSDAITIKNSLKDSGSWWQAKRLDNWIHRAQGKGDFLNGKDSNTFTGLCPDSMPEHRGVS